jgi:TRAP-type mannitol/chloroaromatic compound transport system substrate-binding protein
MAAFTIQGRHPAIFRVTDNVAETHDVTNNTPTTFLAGVIVNVTQGSFQIQHLDANTLVEVAPGATVTIDPTGVSGAVGVGFNDNNDQVTATVYNYVVQ